MKIIKLDIASKNELYETYNKEEVSKELINYLIDSSRTISKKEQIQIIINKNDNLKEDCTTLIREGLKQKYNKNVYKKNSNDKKQFLMLLGGISALILATFLGDSLFNEIALIGGWVLIWEMIESDLFEDNLTKKENKLIKKLIDSEYIEK